MTVKFFETNHQFPNQKLWNTFTFLWMQIFMVAMVFPEFKIFISNFCLTTMSRTNFKIGVSCSCESS